MGIVISHYKDLYHTTSRMEIRGFFLVAHVFGRIKQCIYGNLFGLLIQWPVQFNPSEETTQNISLEVQDCKNNCPLDLLVQNPWLKHGSLPESSQNSSLWNPRDMILVNHSKQILIVINCLYSVSSKFWNTKIFNVCNSSNFHQCAWSLNFTPFNWKVDLFALAHQKPTWNLHCLPTTFCIGFQYGPTWRIIPVSKPLITISDRKSPNWGNLPLRNGLSMICK